MDTWNKSIWDSLRARVERLPHAVLIQGPAGVGKLALAEVLAKRLLCEAPTAQSDPCGTCDACRWGASGNHPDLRRVEPEELARFVATEDAEPKARASKPSSEIKIDQIRELADFLYLQSHRGGRRVAIVHPAETMNPHAANALLKGLEEPPPGAMFVLVSHQPARLLPTIRSRCVVVTVPRPQRDAALGWLASQPQVQNAERWLAYAGGSPRLALEYAATEKGAMAQAYLDAIGAAGAIVEATDRESLGLLAEALQKVALDQLCLALAGRTAYGTRPLRGQGSARRWAAFARYMGGARALSRHPLNPRLHSAEMISRFNEAIQ